MTQQSMAEQVASAAQQGKALIDRMRGSIDGLPGFSRSMSVIKKVLPLVNLSTTYVVETVRTDDGYHGFVEAIMDGETQRMYLPPDVMNRLHSQRVALIRKARRERGKEQMAERMANGEVPFAKTKADKEDAAFDEDALDE